MLIETKNKQIAAQVKEQAFMDFQLATLIAIGINNPKEFPSNVREAYPMLYSMEIEVDNWMESYEAMKKIAEMNNKKRKKVADNGNDD